MLEDAFVKQISRRGKEAIASYTLVPPGTQMEEAAWTKLVTDNRFDTVVICRLTELELTKEKDLDPKFVRMNNAGAYNYYGSSYRQAYQPGSYIREETAHVETHVFDVASGKSVWSATSKTEILHGGDPEPQIRKFVETLMARAK
jgi:hypothetical protein